MSDAALVPIEVVLVDEGVSPEFHEAVHSLGRGWTAPSSRSYLLDLVDCRLTVSRPPASELSAAPPGAEVDEDLMALGHAIYKAMGGEWAEVRIDKLADVWSGRTRRKPTT